MTALTWPAAGRLGWVEARRRLRRLVWHAALPAGRLVAQARVLPALVSVVCFTIAGFSLASWLGWATIGAFALALDART